MVRIALDVMGGDHGPEVVVRGAVLALSSSDADAVPKQDGPGLIGGSIEAGDIVLVGEQDAIASALAAAVVDGGPATNAGFQTAHAPDRLQGDESPVDAMRRKPHNSIAVGIGLVKSGEADAFVSAGSTGLVVATATLGLRCLEGIRRPGIAVTVRGEKGPFIVLDVGANPQPKAVHLQHYALMGAAYARDALEIAEPRVGLMNIGSEDKKGHPLAREARELLRATAGGYRFIGNVEGVDLFRGACDVVVCDGFTGNVLLKVSEGCAEYMLRSMGRFMAEEGVDDGLRERVLGRLARDVDYSEYGGALLLGVEGIVTICHGRSEAPAICNALRFAHRAVGARVNEHIVELARSVGRAAGPGSGE